MSKLFKADSKMNTTMREMRLFQEDRISSETPVPFKSEYSNNKMVQKSAASHRRSKNFSLLSESEFKVDLAPRLEHKSLDRQQKAPEKSAKLLPYDIPSRKSGIRPQTTLMAPKDINNDGRASPLSDLLPQTFFPSNKSVFSSLTAAANSLLSNLSSGTASTSSSSAYNNAKSENSRTALEDAVDDSNDDDNETIAGGTRRTTRSPVIPSRLVHSPVDSEIDSISVLTQSKFSGACSITGLKPGHHNWINQDSFAIHESKFGMKNPSRTGIFLILDGHGENGHMVSRYCAQKLVRTLGMTEDTTAGFHVTQQDLVINAEFDVGCSGCTCVAVKLYPTNELQIANLGDSRCVLGKLNQLGKIEAVQLSIDHKPDNPMERKRILAAGGRVGSRQVSVPRANGPPLIVNGPSRVWYTHGGDTVGLAMSRSFGDSIVHKYGVSAVPEITEYKCDRNSQFVLIATDGVWDVVDNQTAVDLVHSCLMSSPDVKEKDAARLLCHYARAKWSNMSATIDDISCVVIRLVC